ncbi:MULTISPECIES: dicarboxylate/amino acid:cation symporter [Helcococcus]|uniref:Dicarboxylate/amino acid:cation symporter n=1 Tax=Helcococcus bovis TaxID=3153252 RepID=A0ABW9F541_9FIRM
MKSKKFTLSTTTQILLATFGGILFGVLVGDWAANIKFIGDIFLRLIQMSIVLLVMSSIIDAIGGGGSKDVGKMGFHTMKWILLFTIFSALLGLLLSIIIRPGVGIDLVNSSEIGKVQIAKTSIQDTLVNFVPKNIISSMANGEMVPLIVFSVIFGLAMGIYTKESNNDLVVKWIKGINGTVTTIIKLVMKVAPLGIFALLADVSGTIGFSVILPMLKFLGLLLIGCIIQFLVLIPFVSFITKVNPFLMPKKFLNMSIMALTTTSGAVTLPTKMKDTYEKFGVSRRVTDFTGPITMSMNSTGAVQCYVAAIFFMAQATGINLSIYQMGMAILLSTLMCLGTISVPGGSLIVYTFLATALGLPLSSLSILIGIDWFAGMFRTLMNVDVDVLIGILVANKLGELDRDVYNGIKEVHY